MSARLPTGVKGVQGREDQIFRTKVVFSTIAPVWNHNMFFRVFPSTRRQLKAAAGGGGVLDALVNGGGGRQRLFQGLLFTQQHVFSQVKA